MTVFALLLAALLGSGPASGPVTITTTDANQWVGIDLHVVGWNQQEVRVEQEAIKGDATTTAAAFTKEGNATTVTADYRGERKSALFGLIHQGPGIKVRWTVHVPFGSSLKVRASNGDINVTEVTAAIDADTSNGEITIGGSGSNIIAHTSNGNVKVKIASITSGAPHIDLHSSNGDIVLVVPQGFAAKVAAHTSNGDIHNPFGAATGSGTASLSTNNGDINVSVGR